MDIIFLHEFKVDTLIGVYDWERVHSQKLILDLDIGLADQSASQSDSIQDTIHYGEVAQAITESMKTQHFFLLEAVAEFIAKMILEEFGAEWIRIKITKPGILPDAKQVGVIIERRKKER